MLHNRCQFDAGVIKLAPPPVEVEILDRAHRIHEFRTTTRTPWPENTPSIEATVLSIVANSLRPTALRHDTRGGSPANWPEEWRQPHNFARVVRNFYNVTRQYRNTDYFKSFTEPPDPPPQREGSSPSTGSTPPKLEDAPRRPRFRSHSVNSLDDSPLPLTSPLAPSFSPISGIDPFSRRQTSLESASLAPDPASRRQTSAEEAIHHEPIGPRQPSSSMSGPLDPAIQAIVDRAVQNALQAYTASLPPPQRGERGERGQPGEPGPPGLDATGNAAAGSRWNAADLGFFDPLYDGKSVASGAPPLEHSGKDSYFRDVHAFVDRAKEMAIIKGGKLVRENLWLSLRGTAMEWWNTELSANEKRMTRMSEEGNDDTGIGEWITLLHSRFKEPAHVAMDSLTKEKYTIRDAANRREPREYAQKMLRLARDAGLSQLKNQLDFIFNGIDLEIRSSDIRRPRDDTTLSSFLADIDDVKHDWWERGTKNRSSSSYTSNKPARPEQRQQTGQYSNRQGTSSGYGNTSYQNRPNRGFQPSFQSRPFNQYGQSAYNNQQYPQQQRQSYGGYQANQYGYNQQPRYGQSPQGYPNQSGFQSQSSSAPKPSPALPTAPQRLQITAGQASADGSNSSRQPFRPAENSYRPRTQRAYPASVEDETGNENDERTDQDSLLDSNFNFEDDQLSYADDYYEGQDVNFVTAGNSPSPEHCCKNCQAAFSSRNLLFKHLRQQCWKDVNNAAAVLHPSPATQAVASSPATQAAAATIVRSAILPDHEKDVAGFTFRNYHYATAKVRVSHDADGDKPETEEADICFDSGCPLALGDRSFMEKQPGKMEVRKLASPVPVRGVGGKIVKANEYVVTQLYIDGITTDGKPATACVTAEIHLVDDLKANMLIGVNVLKPQKMVLDFEHNTLAIGSCQGIKATIDPVSRAKPHLKRTIRTQKAFTVYPGQTAEVPVAYKGGLPEDRDFLFEPHCSEYLGHDGGVFAHIVDASLHFVQVRNTSTRPVTLPRRGRLGTVVEYSQQGCYMVSPEEAPKAACGWMSPVATKRSWKRQLANAATAVAVAAAYLVNAGTSPPADSSGISSVPPLASDVKLPPPVTSSTSAIDPKLEHVCPNGVTIYGQQEAADAIAALVDEYQDLFIDKGTTVDIPEEEWMPINLKPGAEAKPAKVYPLGQRDREVVDRTFDKLHAQGKMHFTSQPTPFSYPVFVVWRDTPEGRKGRPVIDIRGLNEITEADSYPLPLQGDVISAVAGSPYISTMDAVGWFHQFNVRRSDRPKFTVVSHRGQEESSVALMGYKGSPPYVQRQTDKILRPYKDFAKAYVDDIIVHSRTLAEHLNNLRQAFDLFRQKRISLAPSKCFLGFPSVMLLGQRVDSLGMATAEEKIAAISALRFPLSLQDLDHFLGLTGWLRSSVPRYAQRANPLQERKTTMTRLLPATARGPARKRQAVRVRLHDPTHEEVGSFQDLKGAFKEPTFLTHFDRKRKLFADLDSSKSWGFAGMVYHVEGDPADGDFPRTKVQPIMFLSRCLNGAEKNYWPTELEVAGIVWVVRKIRHMIEASECPPTIIYTDHSAAVPISRQTSLTTSSTDKLNLRLVRASQYLSGFNIAVRHKSGKSNIVPDALSRLQADVAATEKVGVLESLYGSPIELCDGDLATATPQPSPVYHITLVEMADEFKIRLKKAYSQDEHWRKILAMLKPVARSAPSSPETPRAATASSEPLDEASNSRETRNSPVASNPPDASNSPETRNSPAASNPPEASNSPDEPETVTAPSEDDSTRPGLRFRLRQGLIYFTAGDGRERLCVPASMEQEVFQLAHDQTHHGGFHRTYDRITSSVYIRQLTKRLKAYIAHCPECQLNQTKRHLTYGELTPVVTPAIPFHTIAMDWIVALPVTRAGFNTLLTITCKFTKRILLIPGVDTWDTATWAEVILTALMGHDWGIPAAIISDRDTRFMSKLWTVIAKKLDIAMLTSTAWHSQTNGQSERTNQTIEVALRFHITAFPNEDWDEVLPYLQAENNNVTHATTGYAPNELAYGFKVRDTMGMLADLPPEDFSRLRLIKREEAEAAMAFASALSKARYDLHHKAIASAIEAGSMVYLRLHQGYTIPGLANKKLSNQRVGPFKVIEAVGKSKQAYRLELPPVMKIHPVISIAQLEPATPGPDPYGRSTERNPPPVAETHPAATEAEAELARQAPLYEIERLIDKRITRNQPHYLVKWKGYGNEHNVWYPLRALDNADELVAEYDARQQENAHASNEGELPPPPENGATERRGRGRGRPPGRGRGRGRSRARG